MRKTLLTLPVLLALVLAACGAAPNATPTAMLPVTGTEAAPTAALAEPTATETQPAAEPTLAPTAAPTEAAPTAEGAGPAPAGATLYTIVPAESRVTYEVGETFLSDNRFATAVGVTQEITGTVTLDAQNPQNSQLGPLAVDVSTFKSDSGRRDGAIRDRFLESSRYPMVTFVATGIEGLPAAVEEGVDYPLKINGDLTVRETTRPVSFNATVRLADGQLSGQAVTTILMSEFGFGPISILGVLNTEDQVKVTFDFVARP